MNPFHWSTTFTPFSDMLPNNSSLHLLTHAPLDVTRQGFAPLLISNLVYIHVKFQIAWCATVQNYGHCGRVMGAGWIYAIHIFKSVVIVSQVDQPLKANTGFSHLASQTFWQLRFFSTPSLPFMPNSYISILISVSQLQHFPWTELIPPAVQILMHHTFT